MKELYTQEILKNKQNHYEHITKRERDIISKHLSAGKRISFIKTGKFYHSSINVAGFYYDSYF